MYPLVDSLIERIDKSFNQETVLNITGLGKILKFEFSKDNINLSTNHFNLFKNEFESEIQLLMAQNKNSSDVLII